MVERGEASVSREFFFDQSLDHGAHGLGECLILSLERVLRATND